MRGGWTTEEDIKLTGLLTSATPPSWQDISEIHFSSSRTPSQCRHRWHDTLKAHTPAKRAKSRSLSTGRRSVTKESENEGKGSSSEGSTLARARSTTAQQDPIASLFTSTEDALLLQLLKEGHSPVEIERRWGELSRRIASSSGSGGGGAAGRATKRKEKGAIEERASSIEQENYATLHRGSRTFFLPPIVSHDLFNHPPQSRASSAIPPLTANALDDEAPQASSSSSLSSFSLSPPCPRPHPHPRPPTALPFAEPKTLPRPQRTPFSLTRHVISSPPLTSVEGEETLPRQKQFTALELLAQVAESPKKGRSESRGGVVKCLLVGGEDEEGGEVEGRENGDGGVMRGLLFVSPKKRKAGRRGGEQAPREGRKRAKA